MKLYNTRKRSIEIFQPLDKKEIRMYSCGPTVYDHAHIGNLASYIYADTLRRVLQLSGLPVQHAMNYTDVDDKTIRRSHEAYPDSDPREALHTLTSTYIDIFLDDMRKVGNDVGAIIFLRATDYITGMQELIAGLHKAGFAYIADDGVYFSIKAYQKSGKTYGQLLELTTGNTSEARINNDEYDKDSVHDFVLWKTQKPGEPAWDFMLDGHDVKGRPGWHIECSVMSKSALWQPFDIHTGGVDLIFPHHENEIAQSTALENNPVMAQFFVHSEHILVDGKKMAKSAKNFFTLQDVVDRGYDPRAFRLLVLQAHYRSQVHFSWENMEAAQNRLSEYRRVADLQYQPATVSGIINADKTPGYREIIETLKDDLNTPEALAALSREMELIKQNPPSADQMHHFQEFLEQIDRIFGLDLRYRSDISEEQRARITQRETARTNKDWGASDEIRQELEDQGIGLSDTAQGTIWFRL